jgi:hypothetical protein
MATYALITGDEYTKFEPIAFVHNEDKYEVICQSFDRQKSWYTYFDANKKLPFDNFLARFSYQNVKTGEVTPEIENVLNGLRVKFANEQIVEMEKKPAEGDEL